MILKELFAKLGLNVDEVGFNKADALMGGLKTGLFAVGAVASAAAVGLGVMVEQTRAAADKLDKLAPGLGLTTDAMQELDHAANLSGVGIDLLGGALIKLQNNIAGAAEGSEEQAKAFNKLGIAVRNADGSMRSSDDVLMDLSDAIAGMPDGTEKTSLAFQLLGKQGAKLIPLLNGGSEALGAMRAEAHELGVVLDKDTIRAGVNLTDTRYRIEEAFKGLRYAVAGPLLATFNGVGEAILNWIKANRELVRQRVDKVVALLGVASRMVLLVLEGMWKVLGFIIDNWRLLAVILNSVVLAALILNFTAISASLGAYIAMGRAAVAAAIRSAAAWVAATWPLLVLTGIIALVILLVEDIITALDGGDSVLGKWLGDNWIKTLRGWRDAFKDFWTWLDESSTKTWKDMKRGFDKVFGTNTSDESTAATGFDTDKDKGPGVWKRNKEGVLKFFPLTDESGQATDLPEGGDTGFKDDKGRGTGKWKRLSNGLLRFFPDADNASMSTEPSFGTASTPSGGLAPPAGDTHASFSVQQTIYGASGQSPGEVAGEAVNQLDAWHQRNLDAAYQTG